MADKQTGKSAPEEGKGVEGIGFLSVQCVQPCQGPVRSGPVQHY